MQKDVFFYFEINFLSSGWWFLYRERNTIEKIILKKPRILYFWANHVWIDFCTDSASVMPNQEVLHSLSLKTAELSPVYQGTGLFNRNMATFRQPISVTRMSILLLGNSLGWMVCLSLAKRKIKGFFSCRLLAAHQVNPQTFKVLLYPKFTLHSRCMS